MGKVRVPVARRYGAQTARAIANFGNAPLGFALGDQPHLVSSLLHVKHAAALANMTIGALDTRRGDLIAAACSSIAQECDLAQDFPVHILHGGGGTSANMNANEVVAYSANTLAGKTRISQRLVDPLDHVNKHQSTNDVYPTACRLALSRHTEQLVAHLTSSERAWRELSGRWGDEPRLARTCLQDAVTSDYASLFIPYAEATRRCRIRLAQTATRLLTVSLGGGIAGQPGATPAPYRDAVIDALQTTTGLSDLRVTKSFADAAQNADDLLTLAQDLDALSRMLVKQAKDLRLLTSGPEGGLHEVLLPAVQPGSSAMPGKVNPVIPEFVAQCSMYAVGAAAACGMAAGHAELDLNVWEGVYVHSLLTALTLLGAAVAAWHQRCVTGLSLDLGSNRAHAASLTPQLAVVVQDSSYSAALAALVQQTSRSDS
jgi:aspartate ammonia-lyase